MGSRRSSSSSRSPPSTEPPASSGVSRETLARALASEEARKRFAERYGIDDAKLSDAVHAGLVRGIDDAEDAGALSPIVAVPLRELAKRVPVQEGIDLINDASPLFDNAQGLLGLLGGQNLGGLGQLIP